MFACYTDFNIQLCKQKGKQLKSLKDPYGKWAYNDTKFFQIEPPASFLDT